MPSFRDYIVEYRSEQIIAEIADMIRNLRISLSRRAYIPVAGFIKNELAAHLGPKFEIRIYMPEEDARQAYVSYNPLTLNVSRGIWRGAELGNSDAEYILAHEMGHLVLHQDFDKAFSASSEAHVRALGNERSAEWQANTFADYFLCPDVQIIRFKGNVEAAATLLNVSIELAEHRITQLQRFGPIVKIPVEGDLCANCNTFSLVAIGTYVQCTTCPSIFSR